MNFLHHVSDQPDIQTFEPRRSQGNNRRLDPPVVWAVDKAHLPNYLLPRECPRVCFRSAANSSEADIETLIGCGCGGAGQVVAIETAWFERAVDSLLWLYEFEAKTFTCIDSAAGYLVSTVAVSPVLCRPITNPLAELLAMGIELRVMPDLATLAAQAAASSLAFSCIRMRNAGLGPGAFRPHPRG